jgi:hypothetical protein
VNKDFHSKNSIKQYAIYIPKRKKANNKSKTSHFDS